MMHTRYRILKNKSGKYKVEHNSWGNMWHPLDKTFNSFREAEKFVEKCIEFDKPDNWTVIKEYG